MVGLVAQTPAGAEVLGAPSDIPAPLQTPELLSDVGFENAMAPWQVTGGENFAIYPGSSAEDQHYLETNTGTGGPGGSVYQDVAVTPVAGHSYMGTVSLRSPQSTPVSVAVVEWALGGSGPAEQAQTDVLVSSDTWTPYSVELDVTGSGHTDLRFQVYLATAGANLDLDAASLEDAGLADAGFESGMGPWQATSGENSAIDHGSSAEDQAYLETSTGTGGLGGGIYQDVATTPLAGHSYVGTVSLRSPSSKPISVAVVVWALGGSQSEQAQTDVTVSSDSWTPYSVELDVADGDHSDLRFQVYLSTAGPSLDLDAASLEDAGLADAGFETGMGPWQATSEENFVVYQGSSAEDQHYLETNSGSGGPDGSIYQDVAATPAAGHSYVGTVSLRSPQSTPVSVAVVVWATGGSAPPEEAQSDVVVSSDTWTRYSVELDVAGSGHDDLRFQVFVGTTGANLDLDSASLQMGTSFAYPTPLRQRIAAIAEGQDQYQAAVVEQPIGSNCNGYSAFFGRGSSTGSYGETCAPGTLSEEWCSDFAQWVWVNAGVDPNVNGWAYTWVDWGEATGTFKPGATDDPEPGDVVVWGDLSQQVAQHVGIVVGVVDGMIDVVSGNAGPEDPQGDVYSVWESGYFDPATSSVGPYPIIGYVAPDSFSAS